MGKLKSVGVIVETLGKEGLCELGFDIPRGKLTARQAEMLNRVEEELPSASDVAKADDTELQEITENAERSTEDLITQLDDHLLGDSFKHPLCELLSLDKELRSIRGSLKVETAKRVKLEECIKREKQEYGNDIRKAIRNRIERLNGNLKVRQESINLLKGRLTNQIRGIKGTITKVCMEILHWPKRCLGSKAL